MAGEGSPSGPVADQPADRSWQVMEDVQGELQAANERLRDMLDLAMERIRQLLDERSRLTVLLAGCAERLEAVREFLADRYGGSETNVTGP